MKKIGIDVGGVIIEKDGQSVNDTSFDVQNVNFVENAIAIEVIAELSKTFDLYIVSFCGRKREEQTRDALKAANISIPEEKWHFTRSRSRQAKGPVCQDLQLDYFIDDTQQVIDIVSKACPNCTVIWFRGEGRRRNVVPVESWTKIHTLLSK